MIYINSYRGKTMDVQDHQTEVPCPHLAAIDQRKARRRTDGSGDRTDLQKVADNEFRVGSFALARDILRGDDVRQAGFKADLIERFGTANPPVLFQDGKAHHDQRSATARFFSPRTVNTRYRGLMEATADRLLDRLKTAGTADLADLSFEMAVAVAAEIVGLTDSTRQGMAGRLNRFFTFTAGGDAGLLRSTVSFLRGQYLLLRFYLQDVRPAIKARRSAPREDVISHLIEKGYSDREILTECLTYGAAGMATTREFIVMAAWHMFDDPDLRRQFLDASDDGRNAILEEILRLEPVVGELRRRANRYLALHENGVTQMVPEGSLIKIDIASVNDDPTVAGACPHAVNAERKRFDDRPTGTVFSFGDGPHRCPGGTVALVETAIFLERLLTVPGIRLAAAPTMHWNDLIASYELRDAIITTTKEGNEA